MYKAKELDLYGGGSVLNSLMSWDCAVETENLPSFGEEHIVEIKLTQRRMFVGCAVMASYNVARDGMINATFRGSGRPYLVQWRTLAQKEERLREARVKLKKGGLIWKTSE